MSWDSAPLPEMEAIGPCDKFYFERSGVKA